MIDLRQRRPTPPDAFEHDRKIEQAVSDIRRIAASHTPGNHFPNHWVDYRHYFADAQYEGKCAYCETRIRGGCKGQMDHYRPKGAITVAILGNRDDRQDDRPGKKTKTVSPIGYWWLAYRWDNWLLSCERCNKWKGSQFPLHSRKSLWEGVEAGESPLLLNPFDEDPGPHFRFDEMGDIHATTEAGEATVDVCGLDRRTLVNERQKIGQNIRKLIDEYTQAEMEKSSLAAKITLRQLYLCCKPESGYAGLARHLLTQETTLTFVELETFAAEGLF